MHVVPLEIHITIIDCLYRSSQHSTIEYSTLRACALVCRDWAPIAQRLLFRRLPEFYHSRVRSRLLRTLRTVPHLAAYIYSITLNMRLPDLGREDNDSEGDDIDVLKLCTNVIGISITPYFPDYEAHLESVPRLEAIPARPVFLSIVGNPLFLERILNIWPSISVIDLQTNGLDVLPRTLQALSTPAWRIPVHGSTANMSPALRDLELQHVDWTSATQYAALITSGMLAQLHTLVLEYEMVAPPRELLEALPCLKTLVLTSCPEQDYALPPALGHLGYHFHRGSEERVAHARLLLDAARALTGLRLVTA
ncbi:hypothetical protein FA95DRAFT_1568160, partial [Auriscalpium vulgare]